jgi:hypothetical protein
VVGHMPPLPPGSAAPAIVNSEDGWQFLRVFRKFSADRW